MTTATLSAIAPPVGLYSGGMQVRHRDVHVQFVAAGFAGLPPQEGADRRPHVKRIRLQGVRVVVEGLVVKALPDRQIGHDADPELREISRRADARPQQDRRTPV